MAKRFEEMESAIQALARKEQQKRQMLEKELQASGEDRAELQGKVSEVTQKHARFKQQLQEKVNTLRSEVAMKQQEYNENQKRTRAKNQELVRENERLRTEVAMLRQEIGLKAVPDPLGPEELIPTQLRQEASEPKTTGRLSVNRSCSSQKQRLATESTPKMKKTSSKSTSQLQIDAGRPPAKQGQRGGPGSAALKRVLVEGGHSSERLSTNSSHFQSHQQLGKKERPTSPLRNHHKDYFDSRRSSEPKAQKRQERSRPGAASGKMPAKPKVKAANAEARLVPVSSKVPTSGSKGASFSRDQSDQQHCYTTAPRTAQNKGSSHGGSFSMKPPVAQHAASYQSATHSQQPSSHSKRPQSARRKGASNHDEREKNPSCEDLFVGETDFNPGPDLRDSHDDTHTIIDQLESGQGSHRDQTYYTHDMPLLAQYSHDMPLQSDDLGRQGPTAASLKQPASRPQSASLPG